MEDYDWTPAINILLDESNGGVNLHTLTVAVQIARLATPEPDTLPTAVASLRRAMAAAEMEDAL